MRTGGIFLLFLFAVHLLFLLLALHFEGTRIPDSFDYLYQASNFRDHNGWYAWNWDDTIKRDYFTKRTPGYAFFIYLLGSKEWLIVIVQNLLSIASWWIVFILLRHLSGKEKASALFAAACLLLQTNQLVYANTLISEIPFQFVLISGFFFLFGYLKNRKLPGLFYAVSLFAIALIIKPVMLFFAIPLALLILVFFFQDQDWKVLPLMLVLPLVIIAWSDRNEKLTGYNHYTSISTVNLKDYNTRLMLEASYGTEKADSVITGINRFSERIIDYKIRMQFIQDTCKKLLSQQLPVYANIHAKGMLAMLLDPGRFDYVNFFAAEEANGENGLMYKLARGDFKGMLSIIRKQAGVVSFFFFLNLLGSVLLVLTALTSLRFLKKETFLLLVLAGIIGYFWVLTGPVGTARYKSAILPLLVLLAGWGVLGNRKTEQTF